MAHAFWLESLVNKAEATRKSYLTYFCEGTYNFCGFVELSPDEILEQRKVQVQSEDIIEKKHFENQLKAFVKRLEEEGKGPATQKQAWTAVKSFFNAFDLDLKFRRADAPRGEGEEVRATTKREMRRLYQLADVRGRAALMMLKDSGLRLSDLVRLNVGDVDLEGDYPMLKLRTRKQGIIAITFLGPEAQDTVNIYLTSRRGGTEKMLPETLMKSSPLFRLYRQAVKRATVVCFSTYFGRLASSAQIQGVTAHSFRRFFETQLESAGVQPNWIDRMIGHRLLGSRGSYSKPTEAKLRNTYIKAYEHLRVLEPTIDHERLRKLEEERSHERQEINDLKQQIYRYDERILIFEQQLLKLSRLFDELRDRAMAAKNEYEKKRGG